MTRSGRLSRQAVARLPTGSAPELLLSVQLEQAGIPFEREYVFAPPRKWRSDFAITWFVEADYPSRFLIEVEGGSYIAGRHTRGAGFEADIEKYNAAAILGYHVLRCTPAQVNDGRCLLWIRQALGLEAAA